MEDSVLSSQNFLEKEIKALLRSGYYRSESDFIKDAVEAFISERADLRTEIAVEMYKRREVSLGGAAELTRLSIEEMKKILLERGIPLRRGYKSVKQLDERTRKLKEIRRAE
jgi:predicted HTH domain antitoxin